MSHLSCKVPFTVDFDSGLFVLRYVLRNETNCRKGNSNDIFSRSDRFNQQKTCNNCRLLRGRNSMGQKPAELTEEVKRQNDFVWFFQTLDPP